MTSRKRKLASRRNGALGGRPRSSIADLKAARTYRPDKDRARGISAPIAARVSSDFPSPIPYRPEYDAYLRNIITLIPKYDPFRDSGDCSFDAKAAFEAIQWFECNLRHVKASKRVAARSALTLRDWQRAIVANLFGWKRTDGTRRYRECLLYVPKKNGKTTFCGGLLLLILSEDPEEGQENYSAAATEKQARLVFQQASGMIGQNPELTSKLKVYGGNLQSPASILHKRDGILSYYKALAANAGPADGANVYFGMVDEYHEHPNAEMADTLQRGTAVRASPLMFYVSTADYDRPESPCNAKREYALMVRDGRIPDASFLPVIFEANPDADWQDVRSYMDPMVNPNADLIGEEFYAREIEKAKADKTRVNDMKRYFLNIITGSARAWLASEAWDACGGPDSADPVAWRKRIIETLRGARCSSGLDLGSSSDLCAFVLRFLLEGDKALYLPWFWMPRDGIREKSPDHARIYEAWIDQGFVKATAGNVTDYDVIREDINDIRALFQIADIAFDPHQATQLSTQLQTDGADVVVYPQAIKYMAEPTKRFRERVASGRMIHGGNPVLRWMAGNTYAKTYKNVEVVMKGKDAQRKIDGIVAAIMAEGRAMVATVGGSVYEGREIKSL